ncbi:hypothetical protein ACHAXT_001468 [Thalassiosira profunda]
MSKSPRKSTPIDVDAFIDDVEVPAEPSLTVPPPIAHVDSLLYDEELAAKRGRSVELHEDRADDAPMPASYIASEHEDSGKKKLLAETGPEKKGKRSSSEALDERMQSKLASGGLQPTVSASAEAREQRSNNAQRFLQLPTRPTSAVGNTRGARSRSAASNDTTSPSVPVLTATLVEDEPEAPVYDAVPVPTNVEDDHRRRKKYAIIFSALVLVIGALVAIIGVVSTSRNGGSGPSPPPTASPVGNAPEPTVAPSTSHESIAEPTSRPLQTLAPSTPLWNTSTTLAPFIPLTAAPAITADPIAASAVNRCVVSWNKSCNHVERTASITVPFEVMSDDAGTYESTLIFHWGSAETTVGPDTHDVNEEIEESDSHQFDVGEYVVGYEIVLDVCDKPSFEQYTTVIFEGKSCWFGESADKPPEMSNEWPSTSVPCEERANKGQCEVDSIGVSLECLWTGQRCITLPVPGVVGGS